MSNLTETQLYQAFIVERTMERTHLYLLDGREYADCSDEELPGLWAALFRELAETGFGQDSIKRVILDVESELGLRGLEPPFDEVQRELALFSQYVQQERREGRPDPADCPDVRAELANLRQRLSRRSHLSMCWERGSPEPLFSSRKGSNGSGVPRSRHERADLKRLRTNPSLKERP